MPAWPPSRDSPPRSSAGIRRNVRFLQRGWLKCVDRIAKEPYLSQSVERRDDFSSRSAAAQGIPGRRNVLHKGGRLQTVAVEAASVNVERMSELMTVPITNALTSAKSCQHGNQTCSVVRGETLARTFVDKLLLLNIAATCLRQNMRKSRKNGVENILCRLAKLLPGVTQPLLDMAFDLSQIVGRPGTDRNSNATLLMKGSPQNFHSIQ